MMERGSQILRQDLEARGSQARPTTWRCAGTAHIVAVLLVLSRLAFVLGGCRFRRYRLQSIPRIMQCTGIVAAVVCLLVELFQLNARIAADPSPLINGDIAPFEWAGEALTPAHSRAGQSFSMVCLREAKIVDTLCLISDAGLGMRLQSIFCQLSHGQCLLWTLLWSSAAMSSSGPGSSASPSFSFLLGK